jgi:hypothetical protein
VGLTGPRGSFSVRVRDSGIPDWTTNENSMTGGRFGKPVPGQVSFEAQGGDFYVRRINDEYPR